MAVPGWAPAGQLAVPYLAQLLGRFLVVIDCAGSMTDRLLAQSIAHVAKCGCLAHVRGTELLPRQVMLALQVDYAQVWGAARKAAE